MMSEFANCMMEYLQDAFARMYRNVHEKFWGEGVYGTVKMAYYMCNFQLGIAEYYIPTCLSEDNIMQYHRVVVSVIPEMDESIFLDEVRRVLVPFKSPMGVVDSTTVFVVAPKTTVNHKVDVKARGLKAMIRIRRIPNGLAIPIIHDVPEVAVKKLLTHVGHFWNFRVKGFLRKLQIRPFQYGYKLENLIFSITVIENYRSVIKHNLRSMVATLLWVTDRLRVALRRIGTLNVLKERILKSFDEIKDAEIPVSCQKHVERVLVEVLTKIRKGIS